MSVFLASVIVGQIIRGCNETTKAVQGEMK